MRTQRIATVLSLLFLIAGSLMIISAPASAVEVNDQQHQNPPAEDDGKDEVRPRQDEKILVCKYKTGSYFSYWHATWRTPADAKWIVNNFPPSYVPAQGEGCPANDNVTICTFNGLDWNAKQTDPASAEYQLGNGSAQLPGDGGCLVRVCKWKSGETFPYWHTVWASPGNAQWTVANFPQSFLAKPGKPCPGNDDVTVCALSGLDYQATSMDPMTANWSLSNGSGNVAPSDSGCPVRVCVAEGHPNVAWKTVYVDAAAAAATAAGHADSYVAHAGKACPTTTDVTVCVADNGSGYQITTMDPLSANSMLEAGSAVNLLEGGTCPVVEHATPDPTPEPEATPTPEPESTPTPEPESTPTPEPESTPTPEPESTPTPDDGGTQDNGGTNDGNGDDGGSSAPNPNPTDPGTDAEVLGKTQTREALAETGLKTNLTMWGLALLGTGFLLLGASNRRMRLLEAD